MGRKANEPFDPNYHKKTDTVTTSTETRSGSTAPGSATSSASTPKINADATVSRFARTALGTYSRSRDGAGSCSGARRRSAAARRLFVGAKAALRPRPQSWPDRVGVDAMFVHLRKLQEIADANNGTRADGTRATTPASSTSQDAARQRVRRQTPEFERLVVAAGKPTLTVRPRHAVDQASLLSTDPRAG